MTGRRCGHTATMVNGRMYVIGGWSEGVFFNDVHVLHLEVRRESLACREFLLVVMVNSPPLTANSPPLTLNSTMPPCDGEFTTSDCEFATSDCEKHDASL
eukprot:3278504-Pyramimonas_sp.AAC.1